MLEQLYPQLDPFAWAEAPLGPRKSHAIHGFLPALGAELHIRCAEFFVVGEEPCAYGVSSHEAIHRLAL